MIFKFICYFKTNYLTIHYYKTTKQYIKEDVEIAVEIICIYIKWKFTCEPLNTLNKRFYMIFYIKYKGMVENSITLKYVKKH